MFVRESKHYVWQMCFYLLQMEEVGICYLRFFKLKDIAAFLSFLPLPFLLSAFSWSWYLLLEHEDLVQRQPPAQGLLRHIRFPTCG